MHERDQSLEPQLSANPDGSPVSQIGADAANAQTAAPSTADELLPLVYDELRRLARAKIASQGPGHTLQPTVLVHEAWLRMKAGRSANFNGRGHFLAVAALAMRQILVDHARKKSRRNGSKQPLDTEMQIIATPAPDDQILAVDEALERLAARDKQAAELVNLRFFAGLSIPEAAEALGVSTATANRLWEEARLWLKNKLKLTA
jgi:RNA polymerase sigma factor (TIGR02999 family)